MDRANISIYRGSQTLAICGAIAPIVLIGAIIIGALVTPGYNHLSDPVSQLASQDRLHPGFMMVGFIVYGILMIALGYELSRSLGFAREAKKVLILFVVHGVGFIIGGFLRDDPMVSPNVLTFRGILHNISFIIGCLALVFGIIVFAKAVSRIREWRIFANFSLIIVSITLGVFFISQLPVLTSIDGLLQRIYGILPLIWVESTSIIYLARASDNLS